MDFSLQRFWSVFMNDQFEATYLSREKQSEHCRNESAMLALFDFELLV
jgi:hypothetical protein